MTEALTPPRSGALAGLRVIDFGQGVSAPHCARLFADFGAEVIKVEPPQGDAARRSGPYPGDLPDDEKSGLFFFHNTDKLGVTC
ncbi:MAG TPA: CoA transferase, partial [Rubrivivax sp.]|nr:CoA transferase [Rubrivivax sp.]